MTGRVFQFYVMTVRSLKISENFPTHLKRLKNKHKAIALNTFAFGQNTRHVLFQCSAVRLDGKPHNKQPFWTKASSEAKEETFTSANTYERIQNVLCIWRNPINNDQSRTSTFSHVSPFIRDDLRFGGKIGLLCRNGIAQSIASKVPI